MTSHNTHLVALLPKMQMRSPGLSPNEIMARAARHTICRYWPHVLRRQNSSRLFVALGFVLYYFLYYLK